MSERPAPLPWLEFALAGALGAALFALTGVELVWVLSGIAAGWMACWGYRLRATTVRPSRRIRENGQVLVGAAIGPNLTAQEFSLPLNLLAVLFGAVLIVLGSAILIARLYRRMSTVDGLTAGLATLPGGLGIMPSVAAEQNRPAGLVALVQASRMTLVILLVLALLPAQAQLSDHDSAAVLPGSALALGYCAVLLLGAWGAARLARQLRVPVPALLGPLAFGCLLALGLRGLGTDPELLTAPLAQELIGQALLGITVGEYLVQRTTTSSTALLGGIGAVLATCVLALGLAAVMTLISPWSFLTCLLIVAPGGAPEMVVVAAATSPDLQVVVLAQTSRQVLVNALMPLWITLFNRMDHDR